MYLRVFEAKLTSIMEELSRAAVAEICKLVEDGYAEISLQMCSRHTEHESDFNKEPDIDQQQQSPLGCNTTAVTPPLVIRTEDVVIKEENTEVYVEQLYLQTDSGSDSQFNSEPAVKLYKRSSRRLAGLGPRVKNEMYTEAPVASHELDGSPGFQDDIFSTIIKEEVNCVVIDEEMARMASHSDDMDQTSTANARLTSEPQLDSCSSDSAKSLQANGYVCTQCGLSFTCPKALKKHQKVHPGSKPFSCNKCDKNFRCAYDLKLHLFSHGGKRPLLCNYCGRRFSQSVHLKQHLMIHTGEKPFSCTQCEKTFRSSYDLKQHLFNHTGERPFSCSQCGKTFSQTRHLKAHLVIHTSERPFSCSHCNKAFRYAYRLKQHQVIHTGEKPFSCCHCGKQFFTALAVKKHLKSCHSQ